MVTVYNPLKIEKIQESPYGSTLFPDFMYYSVRPVRAKPRGICFYVSDIARSIESVHILSRNGKQTIYVKLYGDPYAYSPSELFERLDDAMEACIERNKYRNSTVLDEKGLEVRYQELLDDVLLPPVK